MARLSLKEGHISEKRNTLHLPEGYRIEPATDKEERPLLVLRRGDDSAVAAFLFSGLGPDLNRVAQMAWEDYEGGREVKDL